MTVTVTEFKKLQREIKQLQRRMAKLEKENPPRRKIARKPKRALTERERAIEILRRAGVTRDLTPKEKELAAKWRALSADEKEEVNRELRQVRLDPPLSQLIHDMR